LIHIEGEIVINRPPEEVFDVVADERNEPKYNPQMLGADLITPEPIGVGTQFRAETVTMGRRSEMVIEFTAYDRPRRLASATHMSTMEIEGALTFQALPEGTLMRWTWDLQPRGLLKLMSPLIARMGRRNERAIWTSLKRYVEAAQVE
jgi:uncharacterized protein YndB with AHSA1/START domain